MSPTARSRKAANKCQHPRKQTSKQVHAQHTRTTSTTQFFGTSQFLPHAHMILNLLSRLRLKNLEQGDGIFPGAQDISQTLHVCQICPHWGGFGSLSGGLSAAHMAVPHRSCLGFAPSPGGPQPKHTSEHTAQHGPVASAQGGPGPSRDGRSVAAATLLQPAKAMDLHDDALQHVRLALHHALRGVAAAGGSMDATLHLGSQGRGWGPVVVRVVGEIHDEHDTGLRQCVCWGCRSLLKGVPLFGVVRSPLTANGPI